MKKRLPIFLLLVTVALGSCRIYNPSVMFRTPRDYPFDVAHDTVKSEYVIQKNDYLTFRLFTNDGFKIIDLTSGDMAGNSFQNLSAQGSFTYLVEADGRVNLPIIGRVRLDSMNLREAELYLEDKFGNYYNDPYAILRVINRRVFVFPGQGGAAQTVAMANENMNIIEVLAQTGGLSQQGKAHRIRVIRGELNDPEVYHLDLSTIEGLKEANLYYVQANDIIYVEPRLQIGDQLLTDVTRVLSLVSSTILTYFLIRQL